MSIQAMSWVFKYSESHLAARLVLISIANYANKDCIAWPSLDTIAEEANVDRSTVIRVIDDLVQIGEVSLEAGGRGSKDTNTYYLPKFHEWMERVAQGGISRVAQGGISRVAQGGILGNKGGILEQKGSQDPTRSFIEPLGNQSQRQPGSGKEGLDSTSTPTPPNSKENPEASYRMAKRIYRRFCKGNLGNPGEPQRESWASLIGSYGEDTVLKAFEIWAQELGAGGKKINYPIALFLKNSDEFLEAVGDTFAGNGKNADPKVLDDDEGEMPTAADIRKQRQGQ
jgi:hypothetical protein